MPAAAVAAGLHSALAPEPAVVPELEPAPVAAAGRDKPCGTASGTNAGRRRRRWTRRSDGGGSGDRIRRPWSLLVVQSSLLPRGRESFKSGRRCCDGAGEWGGLTLTKA